MSLAKHFQIYASAGKKDSIVDILQNYLCSDSSYYLSSKKKDKTTCKITLKINELQELNPFICYVFEYFSVVIPSLVAPYQYLSSLFSSSDQKLIIEFPKHILSADIAWLCEAVVAKATKTENILHQLKNLCPKINYLERNHNFKNERTVLNANSSGFVSSSDSSVVEYLQSCGITKTLKFQTILLFLYLTCMNKIYLYRFQHYGSDNFDVHRLTIDLCETFSYCPLLTQKAAELLLNIVSSHKNHTNFLSSRFLFQAQKSIITVFLHLLVELRNKEDHTLENSEIDKETHVNITNKENPIFLNYFQGSAITLRTTMIQLLFGYLSKFRFGCLNNPTAQNWTLTTGSEKSQIITDGFMLQNLNKSCEIFVQILENNFLLCSERKKASNIFLSFSNIKLCEIFFSSKIKQQRIYLDDLITFLIKCIEESKKMKCMFLPESVNRNHSNHECIELYDVLLIFVTLLLNRLKLNQRLTLKHLRPIYNYLSKYFSEIFYFIVLSGKKNKNSSKNIFYNKSETKYILAGYVAAIVGKDLITYDPDNGLVVGILLFYLLENYFFPSKFLYENLQYFENVKKSSIMFCFSYIPKVITICLTLKDTQRACDFLAAQLNKFVLVRFEKWSELMNVDLLDSTYIFFNYILCFFILSVTRNWILWKYYTIINNKIKDEKIKEVSKEQKKNSGSIDLLLSSVSENLCFNLLNSVSVVKSFFYFNADDNSLETEIIFHSFSKVILNENNEKVLMLVLSRFNVLLSNFKRIIDKNLLSNEVSLSCTTSLSSTPLSFFSKTTSENKNKNHMIQCYATIFQFYFNLIKLNSQAFLTICQALNYLEPILIECILFFPSISIHSSLAHNYYMFSLDKFQNYSHSTSLKNDEKCQEKDIKDIEEKHNNQFILQGKKLTLGRKEHRFILLPLWKNAQNIIKLMYVHKTPNRYDFIWSYLKCILFSIYEEELLRLDQFQLFIRLTLKEVMYDSYVNLDIKFQSMFYSCIFNEINTLLKSEKNDSAEQIFKLLMKSSEFILASLTDLLLNECFHLLQKNSVLRPLFFNAILNDFPYGIRTECFFWYTKHFGSKKNKISFAHKECMKGKNYIALADINNSNSNNNTNTSSNNNVNNNTNIHTNDKNNKLFESKTLLFSKL